jgi:hypothetical protein
MDPRVLHGRWLRAPEEDTASESIYRPAGHPLPRARGRAGMELFPDGKVLEVRAGSNDLAAHREGRWHLVGDVVHLEFGDGQTRTMQIAQASPDVLRVKKDSDAK